MQQGATLTTYTFDATGNLTEENAAGSRTTNVYDNENRLTGVKFPGGTRSTYTFDGDGLRRSAFEAGGSLTTFIWDGDDYLGEY
jgi:YD repeat-containing protein